MPEVEPEPDHTDPIEGYVSGWMGRVFGPYDRFGIRQTLRIAALRLPSESQFYWSIHWRRVIFPSAAPPSVPPPSFLTEPHDFDVMESTVSLRIHHEGGPAEAARLADRVASEINRPGTIQAKPGTRPAEPGERGVDIPLAGQLVLTFLSGGAASALINVLAAWLPRGGGDTEVELVLADGSSVTISGSNLTPQKAAEYVEALRKAEPRA